MLCDDILPEFLLVRLQLSPESVVKTDGDEHEAELDVAVVTPTVPVPGLSIAPSRVHLRRVDQLVPQVGFLALAQHVLSGNKRKSRARSISRAR